MIGLQVQLKLNESKSVLEQEPEEATNEASSYFDLKVSMAKSKIA